MDFHAWSPNWGKRLVRGTPPAESWHQGQISRLLARPCLFVDKSTHPIYLFCLLHRGLATQQITIQRPPHSCLLSAESSGTEQFRHLPSPFPSPSKPGLAVHRQDSAFPSVATSPLTRSKRKASDSSSTSYPTQTSAPLNKTGSEPADFHAEARNLATRHDTLSISNKKRKTSNTKSASEGSKAPDSPAVIAPHTPPTTNMDSDDDMNSVGSSAALDDFEDQDSDVSIDGTFVAAKPSHTARCFTNWCPTDVTFDDDVEDDLDIHERDLKPGRKAYEVNFKVYSPVEIQKSQDAQISEVSNILDQPPENTAILLRHARWNKEKLIESYMEKEDEVLENAGLGKDDKAPRQLKIISGFTCEICCEDAPSLQTFAMKCEHRFCADCYRQYLTQKVSEEGESARIRCPGDDCNRIVDARSIDLLIANEVQSRYKQLLLRTYVDNKDNLKWCPAPDCKFALECGVKSKDLNRVVPTVTCKCGHPFCFGCTVTDHQPAPCAVVKKWLKKCADDSETANWISANTKECPKCYSTIEKNGGCNHMTCRKCRHEFCWMCMGVWSEHGTSWYNCNRFEEKSGHDARDAQAKSRQSLERYLHYYNRYANHEQSAKLDKDIALKAEKKMTKLQSDSNLSWIEVQFLQAASKCLQECRQTLKWTYAFAFYLARNNQTEIFEDNQKDLELAVENLSELFEKPTDQLKDLKVEMMDKISYCSKRRVIVLDTTAVTLASGES